MTPPPGLIHPASSCRSLSSAAGIVEPCHVALTPRPPPLPSEGHPTTKALELARLEILFMRRRIAELEQKHQQHEAERQRFQQERTLLFAHLEAVTQTEEAVATRLRTEKFSELSSLNAKHEMSFSELRAETDRTVQYFKNAELQSQAHTQLANTQRGSAQQEALELKQQLQTLEYRSTTSSRSNSLRIAELLSLIHI